MSVRIVAARLPADLATLDRGGWSPASAARAAMIARKHRAIDRVRSRMADYLLHHVCGAPAGYDHIGRPIHPTGAGASASHDGVWVVAATARYAIGVDVVAIDRASSIPNSAFDALELTRIGKVVTSEAQLLKARIWAAKEAHLKRLGIGLLRHPGTIVSSPSARHIRILDGNDSSCVALQSLDASHILAVTVLDENTGVQLLEYTAPIDARRYLARTRYSAPERT